MTTEAIDTADVGENLIVDANMAHVWSPGNVRVAVWEGEEFDALTASVHERGVLVPLLVADRRGELEHQRWMLVDGHRRYAAALEVGLERVPVRVVEISDEVDGQVLAMVANVRRLNLGPVEEADAYVRILEAKGWTQRRLAESLGVSEGHVGARLKLSRLPQAVRERIADGTVPLAAVPVVEKVADVAPAVAEYLVSVEGLEEGDEVPRTPRATADALRSLSWRRVDGIRSPDPDERARPFLYSLSRGGGGRDLAAFGLDRAAHPDLAARFDEILGPGSYGYLYLEEDPETLADQARAYGCLIEVDGEGFVTDEVWLADRVSAALASYKPPPTRAAAAAPGQTDEEQKAAKAWEREKARVEQLAAGARNRDLERVLRLALMRPAEISVEVARLVAAGALERVQAGRVALVFAELHTVTSTGKDDKRREKTTTVPTHEAEEWIRTWVLSPETASEIIGRAAAVQLAGLFADERALPQSQRPYGHDDDETVRRGLAAVPEEVDPALVTHFRERLRWVLGDDEAEGGEE